MGRIASACGCSFVIGCPRVPRMCRKCVPLMRLSHGAHAPLISLQLICPCSTKVRTKLGTFGLNSVKVWPDLGHFLPNDQVRPKLATGLPKIEADGPESDPSRPTSGQFRPSSADVFPDSAQIGRIGPKLSKSGQSWPKLGQIRAKLIKLAELLANFGQVSPKFAAWTALGTSAACVRHRTGTMMIARQLHVRDNFSRM